MNVLASVTVNQALCFNQAKQYDEAVSSAKEALTLFQSLRGTLGHFGSCTQSSGSLPGIK